MCCTCAALFYLLFHFALLVTEQTLVHCCSGGEQGIATLATAMQQLLHMAGKPSAQGRGAAAGGQAPLAPLPLAPSFSACSAISFLAKTRK